MIYLLSLFFNIFFVFFANRVVPGIEIGKFEQVPNVGADLLFAFIVGFFNSIIVPAMLAFHIRPSFLSIVIYSAIISFGSYLIISTMHFGVHVSAFYGVILAGILVMTGAVITNYIYMGRYYKPPRE